MATNLPANRIKKITVPTGASSSTTYDIIPESLQNNGFQATLPSLVEDSTIALGKDAVYNAGTLSTVAGNGNSGSYLSVRWYNSGVKGITTPYDGMKLMIRIPLAGVGTAGAMLSINGNNADDYHPLAYNVSTVLTSHFAVGSYKIFTYDANATMTCYKTSNTSTTVTGVWKGESNYDSNTTTTYGTLDYYFRPYSGANRITRYKLIALDKDNRAIPITTEQYVGDYSSSTTYAKDEVVTVSGVFYKSLQASNKNHAPASSASYWQTITPFTPNPTPFRPNKIWFLNTTGAYAAGAVLGGQVLAEVGYSTAGCTYNFYGSISATSAGIAAYKMIYLCGTYDKTTGLFTLDTTSNTSYYTIAPDNTANITLSSYFTSGKDYILVGATYSSNNYFQLLQTNTMYHFDGTNLVPYDTYNINTKQDTLVSGTNIKTINGSSILGSGDMTITSGVSDVKVGTSSVVSGGVATLGTAASKNTGTSSGNVPVLDSNGKLDSNTLPAIAITDTFVVATQDAMLALTAEVGDVCVRTDLNKSFILKTAGASTLANWQELLTPTDAVTSVNNKTGIVVLKTSDLTNDSGYITGITSSDVTTALGYTPYNSTNPNGYTSNAGTVTSVRVQASTGLSSSTSTAQSTSLNTTISVADGYKLPTTTEWGNKADASSLSSYLPLAGGTMTGCINTVQNAPAINLRTGHNSYNGIISYRTSGNEAVCFDVHNAVTSFIFRTKDSRSNTSSDWSEVTPSMQIKNQKVAINKLIANATELSYNLDVNGTANATTLYENGTSLASKYLQGTKYNANNPDTFIGYSSSEHKNALYQLVFKNDSDAQGICWNKFANIYDKSGITPSQAVYNGFYYVSSSTASYSGADSNPFLAAGLHTSNYDFRILTTGYNGNDAATWLQQIATDFRSNYIFFRRKENGTWYDWVQIAKIGDSSQTGSFYATSVYAASDERLKENIKPAELDCGQVIDTLQIKEFNFKADEDKKVVVGAIAQELKAILPEKYQAELVSGSEDEFYSINEGKLLYVAIGALKEERAKTKELEERLARLEELIKG